MLSITIHGKPIPLKRHRHTKSGMTYNSQRKEIDDYALVCKSLTYGKSFLPFDDPIKITVTFFMPIPKSSKSIESGDCHFKKPDLDNLFKFFSDSLNGVLWSDDSIICEIDASKVYSDNPRTEIQVTTV